MFALSTPIHIIFSIFSISLITDIGIFLYIAGILGALDLVQLYDFYIKWKVDKLPIKEAWDKRWGGLYTKIHRYELAKGTWAVIFWYFPLTSVTHLIPDYFTHNQKKGGWTIWGYVFEAFSWAIVWYFDILGIKTFIINIWSMIWN